MKSEKTIWLVEDDSDLRLIYGDILASTGASLEFFETMAAFENAFNGPGARPSLLIADLNLPDGNFLEFLSNRARTRKIDFPFIVISSLDHIPIIEGSFEGGALDFITKPFKKNELLVKVDRALSSTKNAHGYTYDPYTQILTKDGKAVANLSLKEMRLFTLLQEANGKPIERDSLYLLLWPDRDVVPKTLDVHIFNMRRKLIKTGLKIKAFKSPSSFALFESSHSNAESEL